MIGGLIGWAAAGSDSSTGSVCAATTVASRTLPSIVTINAQGAGGAGTGSGEVIRFEGYVLTNNHVISVAANNGTVSVQFDDGHTTPATITGRDPATDLAVLKIDNTEHVAPITLGSSGTVRVGQPVVALGAPLGLSSTVTAGIVSALDRNVQVPGDNGETAVLVGAVQTDASINPGNSGGALVNCRGQLIGVNSAGATVPNSTGQSSAGSVGLNFAIPVDLAVLVADEIIKTGVATHAYLGLQAVPLSSAVARSGLDSGLYVTSVSTGSPAAAAGLRPSDVIKEIDGQRATTTLQLSALELGKRRGDKVTFTYQRGDQTGTATVTLASQP
ncbi:MAG TPA: trypsin-like peptidase domain-containing protein [Acidimicrobiales bacterium]